MPGGYGCERQFLAEIMLLPPIKVNGGIDVVIVKKSLHAQRHHEFGIVIPMQIKNCLLIEVIVVIMADEYEIDGRKVFEFDSRGAHSLGADPLEGTGAFTPDGISENIQSIDL